MTYELTLSSRGRWFGWHWTLGQSSSLLAWSGYAFTRRGAIYAANRLLRQEARSRDNYREMTLEMPS